LTLAARQNAAQTPSDKIAANGQLDGAIGRLFLIVENYPQLIARERPTTDDSLKTEHIAGAYVTFWRDPL